MRILPVGLHMCCEDASALTAGNVTRATAAKGTLEKTVLSVNCICTVYYCVCIYNTYVSM